MLQINQIKNRRFLGIGALLIIGGTIFSYSQNSLNIKQNSNKKISFVPTENEARKIAEIILVPIFGKEIQKQKPFKVTLVNDSIWVVTGVQKEIEIGGVAYIEIQKSDCKVLKVTHGK